MLLYVQGTRNTGKSIANHNTANPTAMLLASCLLLDHVKLHAYASMIRRAILSTITETRVRPILTAKQWKQKRKRYWMWCLLYKLPPSDDALHYCAPVALCLHASSPLFSSCTLRTWEAKAPHLRWFSPSWMLFRALGPRPWASRSNTQKYCNLSHSRDIY